MVWIGGMLFLTLVVVPVMKQEPFAAQRGLLFRTLALRFRTLVWAAVAVLATTGVMLMSQRVGSLADHSTWPFVLKLKLLLVAAMVGVTLVHDFWLGPLVSRVKHESPHVQQASGSLLLRVAPWIARLGLLLGLAVLLAAVVLVRN